MDKDKGASADADRATAAAQSNPQAVSSKAGIPSAKAFWESLSDKHRRDAYATETLSDSLGYQLRQLRRQRGLTVEQLAELAGCHPVDVRAAESGDLDATDLDFLLALAAVFEVGLVARFVSYSDLAREHYLPTIHDESAVGNADAPEHETPPATADTSTHPAAVEAGKGE